jgi:formylglycine-generating enzyme required for sulfatase activity
MVTPAFLQSEMCCQECSHFREREARLGRDDLIFPLHYIDVDDVDANNPGECHDRAMLTLLRSRQMVDFRLWRFRDPDSKAVAVKLDEFAVSIRLALRRQMATPTAAPVSPSATVPPAAPSAPPPASRTRTQSTNAVGAPAVPTIAVATATPSGSAAVDVSVPTIAQTGAVAGDGPNVPEMVLIPAGSFVMGVPEEESRREKCDDTYVLPLHTVTITRPLRLGKYPVTRGEYAALVDATGYDKDGGKWRDPGFAQTDRDPVVNVSAEDAEAYVDWLNQVAGPGWRLPSEAEWEYAARAGTTTARYWGDGFEQAKRYAHASGRLLGGTVPVDGRLPNGFGLHDMPGNVWEWTAETWHFNYGHAPKDGSAWTTGGSNAQRVRRGGSRKYGPSSVRAGCRDRDEAGIRSDGIGFRVARIAF